MEKMPDTNTQEELSSRAILVTELDPRWSRVEKNLDAITYEIGLQSGELRKQARKLGSRLDEVLTELKGNTIVGGKGE